MTDDARSQEVPLALHWPGKAEAAASAWAPAEGAVAEETLPGGHLFLEGDNLDALKGLRATHEGRVKLVYIDPPYNTGSRFVYQDRLGRAAWLSMMLPRLMLARTLLREDGAIFVSIDDREAHHLRVLMNEVFGEANFVSTIVWRKKVVRGRGARHVLPQTEYVLCYARAIGSLPPFSEPLTDAMRAEYKLEDELGPYKLIPLAKSGTSQSPRPNLLYPITAPDGEAIACPTHQWRWSKETLEARRDEIVFRRRRDGRWAVYTKQRLQLEAGERRRTPVSYYDRATTTDGTAEIKGLFGRVVLDFPKPSRLIKDLLVWAAPADTPDCWVLDFFAGSCPTAQAVLELNAEDRGERRFICVQSPVPTGDVEFQTIAAIGRARIAKVRALLLEGRKSSV